MDKCKTCGKELIHEKGKRKKQFCNNTCRSANWVKKNKVPKVKTIPIEEWNEIQKKLSVIEIDSKNESKKSKPENQEQKNIENGKYKMPDGLDWKGQLDWKRNH